MPWELWLRTPSRDLTGLVAGLWGGDSDSNFARHRLLPNAEFWLMFNLGPPQRLVETEAADGSPLLRTAFVGGLQESPLTFESVIRHPRAVAVRFRPLGACAFFGGLPLIELANKVFDLEALLGVGAGVERLRQRLIEAPHLGAALDQLEDWLLGRMLGARPPHPVTRAALHRLAADDGDLRVQGLARELGVSARYVNGLFHREVGLSVKGLHRILRFERALDELLATAGQDLSAVAHACGYYDQSHLNRDFRELAGMTPTQLLPRVFQAPGWREIQA